MPTSSPTRVNLEKIVLEHLSFELIKSYKPVGKQFTIEVNLDWEVQQIDKLRFVTICTAKINSDNQNAPFKSQVVCRVVSSAEKPENLPHLHEFSNLGAVLNAIIFLRELIRDLTSRSDFGPVFIPLININDLQQMKNT